MSAALVIAAVLAALVLGLLAVPIDVAFQFEGVDRFAGRISVGWLFGLARFRIPLPGPAGPKRRARQARAQTAPAPTKPPARTRAANVLAALKQTAFRRRVYRFARALGRATHARELYLRLQLGLGDPADTGRLWAFVGPLNAWAQNLPSADVRVEPAFADPVFEFDARGRFLLIPLQFFALALAFALSPATIRAWRTLKGYRG